MDLKEKIEKLLSDILSDKYECKVTLRFERSTNEKVEEIQENQKKASQCKFVCDYFHSIYCVFGIAGLHGFRLMDSDSHIIFIAGMANDFCFSQ